MCRLCQTPSIVGRGVNHTCEGVSVVGGGLVSSEVGESASMESPVVMGCVPVSAITSIRSGTLWKAPSPLSGLADGGMNELAGRIVAADAQGLVVRALPGNMGT